MNIQGPFKRVIARLHALLRADLRDRVTQHSFLVLTGHLSRLGLGIISSAILARGLGPEGLTLFTVVGATIAIVGTIADFGLRLSAVRHIAANNGAVAQMIGGAYARWKVVGSLLLTALLFLAATPLARLLNLPAAAGVTLLRLSALIMLATLLSGVVGTILHALSHFAALTLTQIANVALTVLLMAALWLVGKLTVTTALMVGGVSAIAAALLGYALLPATWRTALRHPVPLAGRESRQLLRFSGWLWLSNILSIAAVQVDVLLLNLWLPAVAVGIYALARNLAFKADILNQTLHVVLVPGVSALTNVDGYRAYIRRTLSRSLLLALLLLLLLPLARPFILAVYGPLYVETARVFYALSAVILLDLVASPLVLLALPMNRPRLLAASDGVQLVLLVVVGMAAVPELGIYGIVLAKFVGRAAGIAVTLVPILRYLRGVQSSTGLPYSVAGQDGDTVPVPVPHDPT